MDVDDFYFLNMFVHRVVSLRHFRNCYIIILVKQKCVFLIVPQKKDYNVKRNSDN